MLKLISFKDTFGVGTVSTKGKVTSYTVKTFKDLAVIVNHFKLYPLVSSKYLVVGINIGYKLIIFWLWQQKNILIIKV